MTITLYHGTDIETAKKVAKSGLKPSKSHWDNCPSHDDHVYLTDTFAIRFGITRAMSETNNENNIAIIEVQVQEDKLYPDEDYLGQIPKQLYKQMGLNEEIADMEIIEKTIYYRDNIEQYKHLWKNSLDTLGTCSYKGRIKSKNIKTIKKLQISEETNYLNIGAEINFGYFTNHNHYHKYELKKILGHKLSQIEQKILKHSTTNIIKYLLIKNALLMGKLNKCYYHTTGNPEVDSELFMQDDMLIFKTVLHDLIKLDKPEVNLSTVYNISVDAKKLINDEEVCVRYEVNQKQEVANNMYDKYLKSVYR